ncbi:MAG: class I SAM-dependent methyltransferase [Acidimicrobiales bacterium]
MAIATIAECCENVPAEIRSDKDKRVLDLYDQLIRDVGEDRPLNFLEVGVFRGGSLLAFAQRLPRAHLLGIDIEEPSAVFFAEVERLGLADRVTFRRGSQTDAEFLHRAISETFGGEKLDVVTEDAMHTYAASRATFDAVFIPWVRTGGFYAIEDWGTGYWPQWEDGHPDGRHGMVRLVKELIDALALPDRTRIVRGARALNAESDLSSPISHAVIANTVAAYFRGDGGWLPPP